MDLVYIQDEVKKTLILGFDISIVWNVTETGLSLSRLAVYSILRVQHSRNNAIRLVDSLYILVIQWYLLYDYCGISGHYLCVRLCMTRTVYLCKESSLEIKLVDRLTSNMLQ